MYVIAGRSDEVLVGVVANMRTVYSPDEKVFNNPVCINPKALRELSDQDLERITFVVHSSPRLFGGLGSDKLERQMKQLLTNLKQLPPEKLALIKTMELVSCNAGTLQKEAKSHAEVIAKAVREEGLKIRVNGGFARGKNEKTRCGSK